MEQYVGDKDIFVMHTVADISGLNSITKDCDPERMQRSYGTG